MTIGNQIEEELGVEGYDQLVTAEFAPFADFAGFGMYEAVAVQETGRDIAGLIDRLPGEITDTLWPVRNPRR